MAQRPDWHSGAEDHDERPDSSPSDRPKRPSPRPGERTRRNAKLPDAPASEPSPSAPRVARPLTGTPAAKPGANAGAKPNLPAQKPRVPGTTPAAKPSKPGATPGARPFSRDKRSDALASPAAKPERGTLASPAAGQSGHLPGWRQAASAAREPGGVKDNAKSAGKQYVKQAGVKAAAAGVTSVTGVPAPAVEKAINIGMRHWRGLLALVLIIPVLPLVFFVAIIATGTFVNSTAASAACSAAATAASSSTKSSSGPASVATPPPADQLSLFMAAERWVESRNNYTEPSAGATWDPSYTGGTLNGSGAFGAYQYIQPTWYSYAMAAGVTTYASQNPVTLPSNVLQQVQDKIATWEFSRNYSDDKGNPVDTGNTWMWVAEQHFDSPDAIPAKQGFAPGNNGGETMAEYGNLVVTDMATEPWLTPALGATTTTTANATLAAYSGGCNATEVSGPLASRIVQIAQDQAKLAYTQAEGNAQYGADAWGTPGLAWCAFFASWVLDQAGVSPPPGSLGGAGELEAWLVTHGGTQLAPTATPIPGDLVFFGTGVDNTEHVATVTQVLPDGKITIVSGNSGNGSNSTSDVGVSKPSTLPLTIPEAHAWGMNYPVWAYVQPAGV